MSFVSNLTVFTANIDKQTVQLEFKVVKFSFELLEMKKLYKNRLTKGVEVSFLSGFYTAADGNSIKNSIEAFGNYFGLVSLRNPNQYSRCEETILQ